MRVCSPVAPRLGERGLKYRVLVKDHRGRVVAPRVGERGLKLRGRDRRVGRRRRSPLRGAWIEILYDRKGEENNGVAPRLGERGLKYVYSHVYVNAYIIAPRVGECGLKY